MTWQRILPGCNAWLYEYAFWWYKVNALAVMVDDGCLAIVSPPIGLSEADFSGIDAKGQVTALIASCAGHDAGQSEWQRRYPDAIPYAPTNALALLETFERPFVPLSTLRASQVQFREFIGTKSHEMIAILDQGERRVVYLGELLLDDSAVPDALTQWLTREPHLRINPAYSRFLGADVHIVADILLEVLTGDPVIVLSHGPPLSLSDDTAHARSLLKSLSTSGRS